MSQCDASLLAERLHVIQAQFVPRIVRDFLIYVEVGIVHFVVCGSLDLEHLLEAVIVGYIRGWCRILRSFQPDLL